MPSSPLKCTSSTCSQIETSKAGLTSSSTDILIPGMILRNRAVHGDIVAVELLSKSEWRSKLNRLAEKKRQDEDGEEEKWERGADVSPTGRVVAVMQRNWK